MSGRLGLAIGPGVRSAASYLIGLLTTAGDALGVNTTPALARIAAGPVALGSGTALDFSAGYVQTKTITTPPTFTATNYDWARVSGGILVILTNSGGTVAAPTWPGTTTFVGTWNTANAAVNRVLLVWTGGTAFTATLLVPDVNPTTTVGDRIVCSTAGTPGTLARLPIGTVALSVVEGSPDTCAVDVATGTAFTATLDEATTFSWTNETYGHQSWVLKITNSGTVSEPTWPAGMTRIGSGAWVTTTAVVNYVHVFRLATGTYIYTVAQAA